MKRLLLTMAVIAPVLAVPAPALAQRHGGGGGHGGGAPGGAHVGGAHMGGPQVGGAHVVGGYGYHYGYPYYRHYGYYGYPGFYGIGAYYYNPGYYAVSPTTIYYSNYFIPTSPNGPSDYGMPGQGPPLPKNQAQNQEVVPDAEATVLFDGVKTTSVGKVRLFDPPELEPGVWYSYKVTASWGQGDKAVTDARKVWVMGGQGTLVDFTRPAPPEAIPLPTPEKK
jgi:uncharacterized protein (TIGR03000 family)